MQTKFFDIVFDQDKGTGDNIFVGVEDDKGASFSLGLWVKRDDGYMVIRVRPEDMERVFSGHMEAQRRKVLIHEIEQLYPPDAVTMDKAKDLILQAFMRSWRDMPTFFLEALHRECQNKDRMNARGW